jgi:hypothetical protein
LLFLSCKMIADDLAAEGACSDRFWPLADIQFRAFQRLCTSGLGESSHLAWASVRFPPKSGHSARIGPNDR